MNIQRSLAFQSWILLEEFVRGAQLAEIMQKAFAKLTRGMLGQIQFAWSDLDEAFSRKSIEQRPRDVKLFGKIA